MARALGWLCFHDHDSRRSTPGFPGRRFLLSTDRRGMLEAATIPPVIQGAP